MTETSPVLSFADFARTKYFTALDGLRGISILLVLLHHVPPFQSGPWAHLQENGRFGVSFFFVISGFLICTLLLRERRQTGGIALRKFYARRALRLLPLYYAVLAIEAVTVFGFQQYSPENEALFRDKLPAYLLYHSNWLATATQGPFFVAWSLAVEEQFYLLFGLAMLVLPARVIILLLIAGVGVKFFVYQQFGNVDAGSTIWRVLFSYQEAILWGVGLAFALHSRRGYAWLRRVLRPAWVAPAAATAIVVIFARYEMQGQSTPDAEVLFLLMTLLIASLVTRPSAGLLTARPLVHLGRISYGIYLLHMPVMSAVKKVPLFASPGLCFVVTVSVVVALATVVYTFFEAPIIAYYKRRYTPTPRDRTGVAPVMTDPAPTVI